MMIGHNSVDGKRLHTIVERIGRLEEEKKNLASDIRDVYTEAKLLGFDIKALREIIRLRQVDAKKRADHEMMVSAYKHALGMLVDTPLGQAAIERIETTHDTIAAP